MPSQTDRLNSALAGRYRIERHLGEGGMAAVYLAEDVKHDRKVALKLLKPELAAVLGAERFVQEIKTTAALQHPHILPLFDSGTADGFLYYVMPFIQGETLRDKLNRETQLGVDDAVRIAREVADALDYAHRHGVIHRDIKPENILLHDGRPMVADFGIALALSAAAGGRMTETGLSLGTPHYMSPEQATAEKEITARSDIYSLGSVLYEMLAGSPPHVGASAQQIIMKIITEPAEAVTNLRKSVPPHVAAAVAKSLEKLPADRFETAKAFGDALGNPAYAGATFSHSAAGTQVAADRTMAWVRRVLTFAPWIVTAAFAVLAVNLTRQAPVPDPRLRFELTFASDVAPIFSSTGPRAAISPDGSRLVYVGPGEQATGTRLYVRALDDLASVPLLGTEGALRPQFSPDGRWIAFGVGTLGVLELKRVPASGGPSMTIVDSVGSFHWGDGDVVIFQRQGGLWRVSAAGGSREQITTPDTARGETNHAWPFVLPGGASVVFIIQKGSVATSELAAVRLDGARAVVPLNIRAQQPRYIPGGFILAGNLDGDLIAVPFDASRLRVTGPSVTVLEGVEVKSGGATEVSIAQNGTLAYITGASIGTNQAVHVDRSGREQVLIKDEGDFSGPKISPDGRRLLVTRRGSLTNQDIWVYDIASGSRTRLTSDGLSGGGSWSPDGQRIVWVSIVGGIREIRRQAWDGGGSTETLATPTRFPSYVSISRTGTFLLFEASPLGPDDIGMLSLDSSHTVSSMLATVSDEAHASISPDGRWYAYRSDESGRAEVYVRRISGGSGRVPVSVGGGIEPVWSPRGGEIFYRTGTHMVSARVATDPEFRVLRRDTLFADPYKVAGAGLPTSYDVTPDGAGFVMLKSLATGVQHLIVTTRWIDELKQRMAEARQK